MFVLAGSVVLTLLIGGVEPLEEELIVDQVEVELEFVGNRAAPGSAGVDHIYEEGICIEALLHEFVQASHLEA